MEPADPSGTPIRDAVQSGVFLESLIQAKPRPYGQRAAFAQQAIRQLLNRLGNPHQRLKIIHIAGSKGKGSTALLTEAILLAAGKQVGTFTSPHLAQWTERYRINGKEIAADCLAELLECLRPHVVALRTENPFNSPSFFDTATAAALLLFSKAGVDYAILETGLGGRLDATNVVQPVVTCITSIEMEHTEKLGNTLSAIAREKAGIIKAGIPVVVGSVPKAAEWEIVARAKAVQAPLIQLGRALQVSIKSVGIKSVGHAMDLHLRSGALNMAATLPIVGQHQAQNSALAMACVQQLNAFSSTTLMHATQRGLANAKLPGRIEILSSNPWIVVDSAHTHASARALSLALARNTACQIHLVISLSKDKDPVTVCAPLLNKAAAVVLTQAEPSRSLSPDTLAAAFQKHLPSLPLRIVPDPIAAVTKAYQGLSPNTLLCVTGSVYMAGIARSVLSTLLQRFHTDPSLSEKTDGSFLSNSR